MSNQPNGGQIWRAVCAGVRRILAREIVHPSSTGSAERSHSLCVLAWAGSLPTAPPPTVAKGRTAPSRPLATLVLYERI